MKVVKHVKSRYFYLYAGSPAVYYGWMSFYLSSQVDRLVFSILPLAEALVFL